VTRPILIVDEPQSVDGGLEGRGKEALGALNPLCTLRYPEADLLPIEPPKPTERMGSFKLRAEEAGDTLFLFL